MVQDLRLRLDKSDEQWQQELGPPINHQQSRFGCGGGDTAGGATGTSTRPMPAALPVGGRTAVQTFVEFGLRQPAYVPRSCPYKATVEARLGHNAEWVDVLTFDLHTEAVTGQTAGYIAYSKDPKWEA